MIGRLSGSHSGDSAPVFQMSLEKVWELIERETDAQGRFMFAGWVLSGGSHVQHKQALALAHVCQVSPQAATNWLNDAAGCSKEMKVFVAVRCTFDSEVAMIKAYDDYFGLGLVK